MFDIAWTELLVLAIIIIVVVGPRDLPKVMRSIGSFMRRARALASQFQSDLDQLARESEIDELRNQARAYQQKFREPLQELDASIDPTTGDRVKTATDRTDGGEPSPETSAPAEPADDAPAEPADDAPDPQGEPAESTSKATETDKDRREAMSGQASPAAQENEGGRG